MDEYRRKAIELIELTAEEHVNNDEAIALIETALRTTAAAQRERDIAAIEALQTRITFSRSERALLSLAIDTIRNQAPEAIPQLGTRNVCKMCNQPIEYIGPYWHHTGALQPRHPALPKETTE